MEIIRLYVNVPLAASAIIVGIFTHYKQYGAATSVFSYCLFSIICHVCTLLYKQKT